MMSVVPIQFMLLLAGVAGCSGVVQDLGKGAGEGAASGAVVSLKKPANQQGLANAANSPGGQEASKAVGEGLGRGIVDGLATIGAGQATSTSAGQPAAVPDPNSAALPSTMPADVFSSYVRDRVDPAVAELIEHSAERVLKEALGPEIAPRRATWRKQSATSSRTALSPLSTAMESR